MLRPKLLSIPAAAAAVGLLATGAAAAGNINKPLGDNLIGRQADGSILTSTNQYVTPIGDVIEQDGRATAMAISPDGKTAADLTAEDQTGHAMLTLVDLAGKTVLQTYKAPSGASNDTSLSGILYSPDGKTLWVSQSADLLRFPVNPDGTVGTPTTVNLPGAPGLAPTGGAGNVAVPDGLAYTSDGTKLLVSLGGNNTLGILDPATNTMLAQIPVGNAPRDVVVIGNQAYVANEGGRVATPSDYVNQSYGTNIVADNVDGAASTGTVTQVDLTSDAPVRQFNVGLHPTALLAKGNDLLVANTNDDSVTAINTATGTVGQTFSVNPVPGAPVGAQPNALAMVDANHLAVSLGRDNAVAIYTYSNPTTPPAFDGLLPTGWYPGTVTMDSALGKLVVDNIKGAGSLGAPYTQNAGYGTTPATSHGVYANRGSIQEITPPASSTEMQQDTATVFSDNQWNGIAARNQKGAGTGKPVPVPAYIGDPSSIKHVFLIVKENRTYDQVLGDLGKGNGDPSLAQFGAHVTPNLHALANQFSDIDNLYSSGTRSSDGHNWLTQAFVNDYIERQFGGWVRSYPASGADALAYAKTGFIWDDALRHGLSAESWGEYANYFEAAGGQQPQGTWQQWYHDSQVMEGKASGPLHVPVGYYKARSDVPSLESILEPDFPNFQLQIPDQYRADIFSRDFNALEKADKLPALNMLWVMCDHTSGTQPGMPTPRAAVADNDLATGRIIDQISHSKDWKTSAVFVLEDDSQNGVDHVDGHRNTVFIASPYAKRGVVLHDYWSQINVMRTIEQILGLPPMNQMDFAAEPMFDAFTSQPDFRPFDALPNQVPLDEMPGTSGTGAATTATPASSTTAALAQAWTSWSKKQNFRSEDLPNMDQFNRDVWYSTNHFSVPYPGDSAVLFPWQVPGAAAPTATKPASDS